jgi:hypothetical protein
MYMRPEDGRKLALFVRYFRRTALPKHSAGTLQQEKAMKLSLCFVSSLALGVAFTPQGLVGAAEPQNPDAPPDDIEVQTRGPVHEAYAQPINPSPRPGLVVPKQPPDPIQELPPDQKPEGDNVQWIPGYWAWEADRNDFMWISGLWRVPPPDRKWVPGHWSEGEGGWQWTPGFWVAASQEQVQYVEEPPPDSLDNGPSFPAPDDNSIYVPGSWVYASSGYAWQPGYWQAARPGFVWTPACYAWTPLGYCYVNGYWDYELDDRGLLFAPVCFHRPFWRDPDWCYRPRFCLGFGGLLASLFARPAYCHYYYGDYYGTNYLDRGFYPWFSYGRRYHDPLFGYYGWQHRGDPGWYHGLAANYRARVAGDRPRPPRTLVEQNQLVDNLNRRTLDRNALDAARVVRPLNEMGSSRVRLARMNATQLDVARQSTSAFRQVGQQRQRLETAVQTRTGRPAALSLANVPSTRTPSQLATRNRPSQPAGSRHQSLASPEIRQGTARQAQPVPQSQRHQGDGVTGFHTPPTVSHAAPNVATPHSQAHERRQSTPSHQARPSAPAAAPARHASAPRQPAPAHHTAAAPRQSTPARHAAPAAQRPSAPRAAPAHRPAATPRAAHSSAPARQAPAHSGGGKPSGGGQKDKKH